MSARSQLQSKPVADLRSIAESLGIEPVSYTHLRAHET